MLDDKRIWRVPGKGMPFTALLSQAYVYILYVCKMLVSFSSEQFSCFVDLVSICLLICCCSWLLSVWVCNMLISVLGAMFYLPFIEVTCNWDVVSYYTVKKTSSNISAFSSFSFFELSCCLPIIMSDTSIT